MMVGSFLQWYYLIIKINVYIIITVVYMTHLIYLHMFKCAYCILWKLSPSYDNKYMFASQKDIILHSW